MRIGQIDVDESAFRALCAKWMFTKVAAFGSVLRSDFHEASDVDLLIDVDPSAKWSLMDMVRAGEEFSALFERRVQLVERSGLLKSQNHDRRDAILQSARLIHAA